MTIINATFDGIHHLDEFSAGLTTLLGNWLKWMFGLKVKEVVFGAVTWADLGVILVVLLLVLVVNIAVAALVRRMSKRPAAAPENKKLRHHFF